MRHVAGNAHDHLVARADSASSVDERMPPIVTLSTAFALSRTLVHAVRNVVTR
jgi:hypothetical protein